uniref:TF-B3 domain-containing protein n=1 Tax=Physcomitrium patens TaxID=3218 RepID=A0A7I4CBH3_PHYPA
MDVVNGKIVSVRTERSEMWSALKPSGSRVLDVGGGECEQLFPCNSFGTSWNRTPCAPRTGGLNSFRHHNIWGALSTQGHGVPCSAGLEPQTMGKWTRFSPDFRGTFHKPQPAASGRELSTSNHERGLLVDDHRWGWNPTRAVDQHLPDLNQSSCSEPSLFDHEMVMFESQITRRVSSHLLKSSPTRCAPPVVPETSLPPGSPHEVVEKGSVSSTDLNKDSSMECSAARISFEEACEMQSRPTSTLISNSSDLKRKILDPSRNDQEWDCGWIWPLKILIRKELSVSDVGELGRIILPKRDAEGRLPHIAMKEIKLLDMRDYSTPKCWSFRYKGWINNKSRMYVLENTGGFIKYHNLKVHDGFVVYEDGSGKLVVCGQKKNTTRSDCSVGLPRDNTLCESDTFSKKPFISGEGGSNCVNAITTISLATVSTNPSSGVDSGMNYSGVPILTEEPEPFHS